MKWMKTLSTQTKTFLFVTIILVLFSTILIRNFHHFVDVRFHYMQTKFYHQIEIFYGHLIQDYQFFYRHILRDITESQAIQEALYEHNRSKLYQLSQPIWEHLKEEDIRSNLIHYHLPNGRSFLRVHRPYKYDDNISAIRATPRYVHRYQKMVFGFECGIYALAYRAFAPLFYKGSYIGAVEFGSRPDYLLDRFEEYYDLKGMIFIKKSHLNFHHNKIKNVSIGEYTLQYSTMDTNAQIIKKLKKQHYDFKNYYGYKLDDQVYNIYTFDIKSFDNQTIAKIVLIQDTSKLYHIVHNHLIDMTLIAVLLTILILVIIHLGFRGFIGKLDHRNQQLKRHKQNLKEMVHKQVEIIQKNEAMIRQQSKMVEMGNMIGAITHQWKQPLNVISTLITDLAIKMMIQKPKPNECEECFDSRDQLVNKYLENIRLEVEYMNQTIEDFKNFLKPSKKRVKFSLTAQIKTVERIMEAVLNKNSVTLNIKQKIEDDYIEGYPTEFAQVILNLVSNAKDAIIANNPDNRTIDITVFKKDQHIKVCVQDYAGGIDAQSIEQIFEEYYTTKGEEGTGIGLSIVRDILSHMRGDITVSNHHGGACFAIEIVLDN